MVLFAGLGFAAQALFGLRSGVLFGLLAGFIVANLVPPRGGGCRVTWSEVSADADAETAEDPSARTKEPSAP